MFDHALTFYIIVHLFLLSSSVIQPLSPWSAQRTVVQGFVAMVIFFLMDFPSQHSATQVNIGCLILLVWGIWCYSWFYNGGTESTGEGKNDWHGEVTTPEVISLKLKTHWDILPAVLFFPYWQRMSKLACLSAGLFAFFGFGEMLGSSGYAVTHSLWHSASSMVSFVLLYCAVTLAQAPHDATERRELPVAHYVAILVPSVGLLGL